MDLDVDCVLDPRCKIYHPTKRVECARYFVENLSANVSPRVITNGNPDGMVEYYTVPPSQIGKYPAYWSRRSPSDFKVSSR